MLFPVIGGIMFKKVDPGKVKAKRIYPSIRDMLPYEKEAEALNIYYYLFKNMVHFSHFLVCLHPFGLLFLIF